MQPIGDEGRALPYVLVRGVDSKLKRHVAATGYPAYVIAAAAGIAPPVFSAYMNRRKPISHTHLVRICEVLGCDAEDIVEPTARSQPHE